MNTLLNQPGIYKITSPTGNVYIGQAVNVYKRVQKYKWVSSTMKFRALTTSK